MNTRPFSRFATVCPAVNEMPFKNNPKRSLVDSGWLKGTCGGNAVGRAARVSAALVVGATVAVMIWAATAS